MESLEELRARRAYECRLTSDRALESLDQAEAFLRDRALLTRTTDCALPSLYEACHEPAYRPGTASFGSWPATRWPWFGALTDRGHVCVAVHRGKSAMTSGRGDDQGDTHRPDSELSRWDQAYQGPAACAERPTTSPWPAADGTCREAPPGRPGSAGRADAVAGDRE